MSNEELETLALALELGQADLEREFAVLRRDPNDRSRVNLYRARLGHHIARMREFIARTA